MLAVLRFALLFVIALLVLAAVIAFARPETGPIEKVLLGLLALVLVAAAAPVRRLGIGRSAT